MCGAGFLACALRAVGLLRWPLPALRRQTPKWFSCAYGPSGGAFLWGADLGLGWSTLVIFSGYYGLVCWALLGAGPLLGAITLGAYGLGRGLPVLVAGLGSRRAAVASRSTAYVLHLPFLHALNGIVLALLAGYLLGTVMRG